MSAKKKRKKSQSGKIKPGDLAKDLEPQDEQEARLFGLLARDGELARALEDSDAAEEYFRSRLLGLLDTDSIPPTSRTNQSVRPNGSAHYTERSNELDQTVQSNRPNGSTSSDQTVQYTEPNGSIRYTERSNVIDRTVQSDRPTLNQTETSTTLELEILISRDAALVKPSPKNSTVFKVLNVISEKLSEAGTVYLTTRELQKLSGLSRGTAVNTLKFLVQNGYLITLGRSYYRIGSKLHNWFYSMYSNVSSNTTYNTYKAKIDKKTLAMNPYAVCGFYADYRFKRAHLGISLLTLSMNDINTFAEFILNYGAVNFYMFVNYVVERKEKLHSALSFVRKVLPRFQLPADQPPEKIKGYISAAQSAIRFDPDNPQDEDVKAMMILDLTTQLEGSDYLRDKENSQFIAHYQKFIAPSVMAGIEFAQQVSFIMPKQQDTSE